MRVVVEPGVRHPLLLGTGHNHLGERSQHRSIVIEASKPGHNRRKPFPNLDSAEVRAAINGLFQQLENPSTYNADQFASALRRIRPLLQ
jgi:hypothetical protein